MKLISCECGVVLDKDKLMFPDEDSLWSKDDVIDMDKAGWSVRCAEYVPKTHCPVCNAEILYDAN